MENLKTFQKYFNYSFLDNDYEMCNKSHMI